MAGGAVLIGLSLVGFDLPSPLPTISPAVPMPTPSLLPIPNPLNQSSSGQPPAGAPAQHASGGAAPSSSHGSSSAAGGLAAPLAGAPPATVAGDSRQPAATTAAQSASTRPAAALPVTGGTPPGPAAPLPIAPATLAAALLALFFLGVRLRTPSLGARRYRLRIEFGPGGGPAGAAAAAVRGLLESQLPAGARLRSRGEGAFLVEAPMLQRAVLAARLDEAARRARRVGLSLAWSPVSLGRDQADREPVVALRSYRLQSS